MCVDEAKQSENSVLIKRNSTVFYNLTYDAVGLLSSTTPLTFVQQSLFKCCCFRPTTTTSVDFSTVETASREIKGGTVPLLGTRL